MKLQSAIKCPEIKAQEGVNLFNSEAYDATIANKNKILGQSRDLISSAAKKINAMFRDSRDNKKSIYFDKL